MKIYHHLLEAFLDLSSKSNPSFLSFLDSICHLGHSFTNTLTGHISGASFGPGGQMPTRPTLCYHYLLNADTTIS